MIISPKPTSTAMSAYASAVEAKSAAEAQKRKVSEDDSQQDKSPNDDTVKLSGKSEGYSNSITGNAAYFPVRPGMNADALALGVSKPGAISSSKDKTFSDVAADARKRLDEKYALMSGGGKPYSGSDEDRNSLFGDLDRRSLNAVATNEGGKFSAAEQASAEALMRQQGRLATGYYSGPADQEKNWKDPFANDPVGRAHAALNFMDNMSPEEKATPQWLSQHLALESALNQSTQQENVEKKGNWHFPNLAEILSGAGTQNPNPGNSKGPSTADLNAQILAAIKGRVS